MMLYFQYGGHESFHAETCCHWVSAHCSVLSTRACLKHPDSGNYL